MIPADLVPGDFAACTSGGPGGMAVSAAEMLDGKGFSVFEHAKTYVGEGLILQAEPGKGGAQLVKQRPAGNEIWSTGVVKHTPQQIAMAWSLGLALKGTPYSWLDYAACAAHRLHVPNVAVWPDHGKIVTLQTFIGDTGHQMCSQLVDYFQTRMGVHLFADGRWPGYVVPADIGNLLLAKGAKFTQ